jgi:hypothetical protein
MKHANLFAARVLLWGFLASSAMAGEAPPPPPPPPLPASTSTTNTETNFFAGVSLYFGGGRHHFEGQVGVIYSETNSSGDVVGAKGSLNIPFEGGGVKVRLTGLFGSTDVQAEGGLGYNFGTGSPFGTLGANGPYVQAGAEFWPSIDPELYAGLTTIGSFTAPAPAATPVITPPAK